MIGEPLTIRVDETAETGRTGSARGPRFGADAPSLGGNAGPGGGKGLPADQVSAATRRDIEQAAARLAELARDKQRDLRFRVDESSGRTVITVINAATNEIVRQIPPEEVLSIARNLGQGALVDVLI